eukprot:scaffold375126_cov35-Prasinocladus_malaysianus.AAC.2
MKRNYSTKRNGMKCSEITVHVPIHMTMPKAVHSGFRIQLRDSEPARRDSDLSHRVSGHKVLLVVMSANEAGADMNPKAFQRELSTANRAVKVSLDRIVAFQAILFDCPQQILDRLTPRKRMM